MISTPVSLQTVAVAGNPNAGKTTVFNVLAKSRQKVANYPGVTVERKEAVIVLPSGCSVQLVDLPGCYSLVARSPEEQIAHDVLFGRVSGCETPSAVLCVVDATNLERNLYLATQLLDQGLPTVVLLNMMDLARERGIHVDVDRLSSVLGCPVIPTVARTGDGLPKALAALESALTESEVLIKADGRFIEHLPEDLNAPVESLVTRLQQERLNGRVEWSPNRVRSEALWALLANLEGDEAVGLPPVELRHTRDTLAEFKLVASDLRKKESQARYRYIHGLLEQAQFASEDRPHNLTEKIDGVLLHPFLGPVIFVAVFAVLFQSIFAWAGPAMDLIDGFFGSVAGVVESALPESLFRDMLVQGVIAGVGNTIIFLPQILILFLFLGFLEDSGYLARAAFLMDRLMSSVGLDGKAFIPLLSSFACAIPGIMATRTIPSRKDRLVTILIAPLMACSARLPVYVLLIGTVFAAEKPVLGFFNVGGLVMLLLYLSGIVGAIVIAALFKSTFLKSPKPVLLLELPTYKLPSLRSMLLLLWDRSLLFIKRAGTVILAVTILLWALLSFPQNTAPVLEIRAEQESVAADSSLSEEAKTDELQRLANLEQERALETSYGGQLGNTIVPLIEPLGFDWKIGIGLIASFAAREVFVSTMGVIYGIGGEVTEEDVSLREALRAEKRPGTDLPLYTPLVGLSLLFFYVFACQCMSTIAIVRRETNSWTWPLFMFVYMTALAWIASFAIYQGGRLLGYQ